MANQIYSIAVKDPTATTETDFIPSAAIGQESLSSTPPSPVVLVALPILQEMQTQIQTVSAQVEQLVPQNVQYLVKQNQSLQQVLTTVWTKMMLLEQNNNMLFTQNREILLESAYLQEKQLDDKATIESLVSQNNQLRGKGEDNQKQIREQKSRIKHLQEAIYDLKRHIPQMPRTAIGMLQAQNQASPVVNPPRVTQYPVNSK